jgi:hypothetical protein
LNKIRKNRRKQEMPEEPVKSKPEKPPGITKKKRK